MSTDTAVKAAIPFVDLAAQHAGLEPELGSAIARVIANSAFIMGDEHDRFEAEFGAYLGTRHALGIANGTDALHLALRGLGVGAGDEVILPSWTFIATASAVVMAGATPVLADIDPATYHLDFRSTEALLTDRTRAIIPVHLYGQAMDLAPFLDLAAARNLHIVEDACQAHGATLGGRRVGTLGVAGCFSFYPSKNLGGLGDGGLVATDDDLLASRVRRLRHHGQATKNVHDLVGYTARLDGLQAAVLRVKLPHLDTWNRRRQAIAQAYLAGLDGLPGLGLPRPAPGRDHVYHCFVVRTSDRDRLQRHLADHGVSTAVHYPSPIHLQPAFAAAAHSRLAESTAAGSEVLSLPMFPEMTDDQIARVVEVMHGFVGRAEP